MLSRGAWAVSTVFLDRDGTLNVKPAAESYVTSPKDLALLPGAAEAVRELNAAGIRTVLVTNQRWLSQPGGHASTYAAVHARLERLLAEQGAWLDAAYYCPHAVGVCNCRKPASGMLLRAATEHGLDLRRSVIIGDSDSDVAAGRTVGSLTILLRTGEDAGVAADAVVENLPRAVRLILQGVDNYAGSAGRLTKDR